MGGKVDGATIRARGQMLREAGHLLARRFTVFRANVEAMRRHQVRPYQGNVVLFSLADASPEAAEAWRTFLPHLRIEPVSGTHLTLVCEPHVCLIAERLITFLQGAST